MQTTTAKPSLVKKCHTEFVTGYYDYPFGKYQKAVTKCDTYQDSTLTPVRM